jgi:hypothetical protein
VPNDSEMTAAPLAKRGDYLRDQVGFEDRAELGEGPVLPTTSALGAMARARPATNVPWPA